MADTDLIIALRAQNNKLKADLDRANKRIKSFKSEGESDLKKLGKVFAAVFAAGQLQKIGRDIFNVTAEFQKMEAVLTNMFGDQSRAQQAMAMITEFASKTPFQVNELTDSFIKLKSQGFEPTMEEMRQLGDLAASKAKSFDQLTEAILDAQVGEFTRLKEFGVIARKEGDKVKFTFQGVTKEVDFTSEALKNYVLSLGDVEGVSGAMAAISETLEGKLSNLNDAVDQLYLALGSSDGGLVGSIIEATAALVKFTTATIKGKVKWRDFIGIFAKESMGAFGLLIKSLDYTSELLGYDLIKDIDDLKKKGPNMWSTFGKKVKEVVDEVDDLDDAIDGVVNKVKKLTITGLGIDPVNPGQADGAIPTLDFSTEIDANALKVQDSLANFNRILQNGYVTITETQRGAQDLLLDMDSMIKDSLVGFGENLGAGLGPLESASKTLKNVFGQMLIDLGIGLIGFGEIMKAIKLALKTGGIGAIAAGVAAIAAGTALKASAAKTTGQAGRSLGAGGGGSFAGNVGGQTININIDGAVKGNDLGFLVRNDNRLGQRQRI